LIPTVSVVLPVRDAAETLAECLLSLRAQTLGAHEVVAVDDGSTDSSLALLHALAREDPRLRVVAREAHGLVSALNAGLLAARAPLVARMDADDVAHEDRLERLARRLAADAAVDILGSRVSVDGTANEGMRAYVEWSNALLDHDAIVADLFVESPLVHPSVMVRRRVLQALDGWRAFDGPEDYDLWLRAHAAGFRFGKLEESLLLWRDRPSRLTRTDPRYSPDRFLALKVASLERLYLGDHGRPLVIWGAGRIGKRWARELQARGHRVAAFVEVAPAKIGQRIHGAPVVAVADALATAGALHLAAVGQAGARARIRAEAARLGLRPAELVAVA
jgi:glycosyltransferase involved in cell wall biosynthesis